MHWAMLVSLIVCFFVVGIALDIVSPWMKIQVNRKLPADRRLSWWSRNYRQLERIYSEQHPDSSLPESSRYGSYLAVNLFAAMILVGILSRDWFELDYLGSNEVFFSVSL